MHQVQNVAKDVTPADMAGRMDLRDWMMVTIDGEDARILMMPCLYTWMATIMYLEYT